MNVCRIQHSENTTSYKQILIHISKAMFVMFIARGVYRYYLYGDKLGVRAFYRCSKTGKSGHNDTLYTYLI